MTTYTAVTAPTQSVEAIDVFDIEPLPTDHPFSDVG
jgi:phosphoglycerate dehydrogenase-like enzyme